MKLLIEAQASPVALIPTHISFLIGSRNAIKNQLSKIVSFSSSVPIVRAHLSASVPLNQKTKKALMAAKTKKNKGLYTPRPNFINLSWA